MYPGFDLPCRPCLAADHERCVGGVCGCLMDHPGEPPMIRGYKRVKRGMVNDAPDRCLVCLVHARGTAGMADAVLTVATAQNRTPFEVVYRFYGLFHGRGHVPW